LEYPHTNERGMSVTWVTSLIAKASLIAELLQLRFMRDRRELRVQH
jgi:hypothetical protein